MGKYLLIVFYTTLSVVLIGLVAYMVIDGIVNAPDRLLSRRIEWGALAMFAVLAFCCFPLMIVLEVWSDIKEQKAQQSEECIESEAVEPALQTLYRTNEPNLLGGYMTYDSLDKAWSMIECGRATEIYAETYCAEAWIGTSKANSLVTLLSSGLIYRAK
jgi:hypothetical protein